MVNKCIKLWSTKVNREYMSYISKARRVISKKICEIEAIVMGKNFVKFYNDYVNINTTATKRQLKDAEGNNTKILDLYKAVHESVTQKECSDIWKNIDEGYEDDIVVCKKT